MSYGPSIVLTKLWELESKNTGNMYLAGYLGLARVVIVRTNEVTDFGAPIWKIIVNEPPPRQKTNGYSRPPDKGSDADQ